MTGFTEDDRDLLQTIHADLKILISQGEREMSALDDLKAAEVALSTDVMNAVMLIQTLHGGGTVTDADVEAVVANLVALHNKLLAAAPPPPPGPMEQPVPNGTAPPPPAGP
jgi:hypothetical protein